MTSQGCSVVVVSGKDITAEDILTIDEGATSIVLERCSSFNWQ